MLHSYKTGQAATHARGLCSFFYSLPYAKNTLAKKEMFAEKNDAASFVRRRRREKGVSIEYEQHHNQFSYDLRNVRRERELLDVP